jgi:integrase
VTERHDALKALKHLDGHASLMDAAIAFVHEAERREKLAHVPTVNEAIDLYLSVKRTEAEKGQIVRVTLAELTAKMHIVRRAFDQLKVNEIDEAMVENFIRKLPHAARARHAIRTKLAQLMNFCRRSKWITTNPCDNVTVKVKNDKDVVILSIEEVKQLLSAAQACEHPASVIPYLVLQCFGGLRPTEAERLRWERIYFETGQIEVLGETSKTGETRFVEMTPLLTAWLFPYRVKAGPITGDHFAKTLHSVRAAAGLLPWPKDVLRHTFASYWLAALRQDRAHLAEQMGNSLAVIRGHYRRAILPSVAEEFWKLTPPGEPGKIIPIARTA